MSYSQFQTDMAIAVGVMSGLAVLYAIVRTWSWFRRSGRLAIDFLTIVKFIAFSCGYVANAIFVVILGASIWWEFFYKVFGDMRLFVTFLNELVLLLCFYRHHLIHALITLTRSTFLMEIHSFKFVVFIC